MDYINVKTGEKKSLLDLCTAENASIPPGVDFGDWEFVRDVPPTVPDGSHLQLNGVVKNADGHYYYDYAVVVNPVPPVVVPQSVTRFQAIAALYNGNYLTTVENYFADAATPMIQKLAWQNAQAFERQSPTVKALQTLLNLTDAQVDQLFTDASAIVA